MSEKEGITNIESKLIKISYEIVADGILDEKEINKLLGVLASNGVYAMWVWTKSQRDINEEDLFNKLLFLMNLVEKKQENENFESYLQRLSEDLHKLLFVKQLLEKTLIYARYHAKALGNKSGEE